MHGVLLAALLWKLLVHEYSFYFFTLLIIIILEVLTTTTFVIVICEIVLINYLIIISIQYKLATTMLHC
jgi:hypothetical protein